jgi:hypothetical protein
MEDKPWRVPVHTPDNPGEVVVHSGDRIHSLLVGTHQLIGSVTREHQEQRGPVDATDFSKYRFPEPIEPAKAVAPEPLQSQGTQRRPQVTRHYSELRREIPDLDTMANYLDVYQANHARKSMTLHQEVEEHYLQPLARRLVRSTTGPGYQRYVAQKMRAVSVFDKRTRLQDTFLEELPQIPVISFDASDLTDPIQKYHKNAQGEDKLTEFIARSTGQWESPREAFERDTMNLKKWKILAETRCYHGNVDHPIAKGKEVKPGKFKSCLGAELDQFDPPDPRKIRVRRSVPPSSVDHIKALFQ